jgi:hypothetical protein
MKAPLNRPDVTDRFYIKPAPGYELPGRYDIKKSKNG